LLEFCFTDENVCLCEVFKEEIPDEIINQALEQEK